MLWFCVALGNLQTIVTSLHSSMCKYWQHTITFPKWENTAMSVCAQEAWRPAYPGCL